MSFGRCRHQMLTRYPGVSVVFLGGFFKRKPFITRNQLIRELMAQRRGCKEQLSNFSLLLHLNRKLDKRFGGEKKTSKRGFSSMFYPP